MYMAQLVPYGSEVSYSCEFESQRDLLFSIFYWPERGLARNENSKRVAAIASRPGAPPFA